MTLRAGRAWILLCVVLSSLAFSGMAFLTMPLYRATVVVLPVATNKGSLNPASARIGNLAARLGVGLGSTDARAQESLAVLRSRGFTEAFIREEQLMPELFYRLWDASNRTWKGGRNGWPTLFQAFRYFDREIRSISRDRDTGLVTIQVEWRDRQLAARWANDLVSRVNAELRARAIADADASIGFLERELAATSAVEARQALNRLMEAQINQRMIAHTTPEFAFRVVDRALPPDPSDIKPQRLLLLALGPATGLLFGVALVLIADALALHPAPAGVAQ
jgi:uncharacterized protein involved in exopolysaccharide biosynthesis